MGSQERITSEAAKVEQACVAYVKCSVSWAWPGSSRAVKGQLHQEITESLDAEGQAVSASTRLWDWKHPALAALRSLKREVATYWERLSVDYPEESGVRLLPKAAVDEFETQMSAYRVVLGELTRKVQATREEIIEQSRARRGRAFSVLDYPADLASLFGLDWSYAPLEVSPALKDVSESAYSAEKVRQVARVLAAVKVGEEAQARQLAYLVDRLAARLGEMDAPLVEGERRPPLFASFLEAIEEFSVRFSEVVCWGTDELQEVVEEAGGVVAGLAVEDIKADRQLRQAIASDLAHVAARLARIRPEVAEAQRVAALQAAPKIRVNEELEAALRAQALAVEETREESFEVIEEGYGVRA